MDHDLRRQRLRSLIKTLNKERKTQAKKIDILCNDLINAQWQFIRRLGLIGFCGHFYQSILGISDLDRLLEKAGQLLQAEIPRVDVTFFVHQADGFDLHRADDAEPIEPGRLRCDELLNPELAAQVLHLNKLCRLDDLCAMGLQATREQLQRISAAAVPMHRCATAIGLILICRSAQNELTDDELAKVSAIAPGLARAIQAARPATASRP